MHTPIQAQSDRQTFNGQSQGIFQNLKGNGIIRHETNLMPQSLPESNAEYTVPLPMCAFGMKLLDHQLAFIELFKSRVIPYFGKENLQGTVRFETGFTFAAHPVMLRRKNLLLSFINQFVSQYTDLPNITKLQLGLSEKNSTAQYGAAYRPEYHSISLSGGFYAEAPTPDFWSILGHTLYHELRHAEQELYVLRFMHHRGEALPADRETFAKKITIANQKDETGLPMGRSHPYYHCVVRWYANLYGDLEAEQKRNPNIYEDPDYPVDKSLTQKEFNHFFDVQKPQADAKYGQALDNLQKYVMSAGEDTPQRREKIEQLSQAADEASAVVDETIKLYKNHPIEKDAFECGDAVLALFKASLSQDQRQ